MTGVVIAWCVGVFLFIASFVYILCIRHIIDDSELPYLRKLIKCERVVSGAFILLLIPLFSEAAGDNHPVVTPMTSYGNGSSWNFGWGRPVVHFALAFVGLFLDFHPMARLACALGNMQAAVLDTLSSYDLGTQIECVESGRCALPVNNTLWGLRLLNARDLVSIVLVTWSLLLVGHLCLVIGMCRTRYSYRQLHAGDHNRVWAMQTELAKRNITRAKGKHHRYRKP